MMLIKIIVCLFELRGEDDVRSDEKIYERDIIDVKKMWKKQLRSIMNILPSDYSEEDII